MVPLPTVDSMSMVPRWRLTMPYTMGRPRPVPRSPLVEKKGSRQRRRTSSVMPVPVSLTSRNTWGTRGASGVSSLAEASRMPVRMRIRPPSGIASTALKMRLASISRISDSLPRMRGTGRMSASTRIVRPLPSASSRQRGRVRATACSTIWLRESGR